VIYRDLIVIHRDPSDCIEFSWGSNQALGAQQRRPPSNHRGIATYAITAFIFETERAVSLKLRRWCSRARAVAVEAWALSIRASDDTEGCHIASSSKAGNINVWSSNTGEKIQTFEQSPSKFLLSVAYVCGVRARALEGDACGRL